MTQRPKLVGKLYQVVHPFLVDRHCEHPLYNGVHALSAGVIFVVVDSHESSPYNMSTSVSIYALDGVIYHTYSASFVGCVRELA